MVETNVVERLKKQGAELDARLAEDSKSLEAGELDAERSKQTTQMISDYVTEASAQIETAKSLDDQGAQLERLKGAFEMFGAKPTGGQLDPEAAASSRSGIVNPKGMTLGAAIAQSEAYEELQAYVTDGMIRKSVRIDAQLSVGGSSDPQVKYAVVEGQAKALSTLGDSVDAVRIQTEMYKRETSDRRLREICNYQKVTTGDSFDYIEMAYTDNAAFVAEATTDAAIGSGDPAVTEVQAGLKPVSDVTYVNRTEPIKTMAHMLTMPRRAFSDRPQAMGEINTFMSDRLYLKENGSMVSGNGGDEFTGILNTAGIQTHVSNGTDLDGILEGAAKLWRTGRRPNGLVMNPDEWFTDGFVMAKTTDGSYMFDGPNADPAALQRVWGMSVYLDTNVPVGSAIIGDFKGSAKFVDRESLTVHVTDSHEDYFRRNLVAVLIEDRVGFRVTDARGFCNVTSLDA